VWSVLYALACLGWKCGPYLHFCPGQSGKCLGGIGVAGDLVLPDETLLEFQLSWMPWKMFNYSVPPAVNYCAHQHCMRCSPPWESGPHPYLPCRQVPPKPHLNTTEGQDIVNLEVASSHLPFDGLLLCFAGKNVNLTEDSVDLENITEGGTLYDSVGKEMFGRATTRVSDFLTPWTSAVSGDRYLDALEYGVLSDFLSNDEYYSSTFEYQRYDQFRSWKYTADIGAALVRDKSRGNNCMLMSGAGRWKQRTRYEITLRVSGPGNLNVSEAPIWLAPLKYDEYAGDLSTWPEITNAEDLKASTSVLFPTLSVRGPKEGAVCSIVRSWAAQSAAQESAFALAQHRADPAATAAQSLYVLNGTAHDRCSFSGQVTSPRTGECIRCPRLNDAARDGDCRLHLNATRGAVRWGTWTNDGLLSNNNIKLVSSLDSHDCCASNTYPQLIGDQACGGVISPNLADTDLNPANAHRLLTQRLCVRYGYIRRVWEKSFCALECLQDGDVDFRKKVAALRFRVQGSSTGVRVTLLTPKPYGTWTPKPHTRQAAYTLNTHTHTPKVVGPACVERLCGLQPRGTRARTPRASAARVLASTRRNVFYCAHARRQQTSLCRVCMRAALWQPCAGDGALR
jgi:hypothetical protein